MSSLLMFIHTKDFLSLTALRMLTLQRLKVPLQSTTLMASWFHRLRRASISSAQLMELERLWWNDEKCCIITLNCINRKGTVSKSTVLFLFLTDNSIWYWAFFYGTGIWWTTTQMFLVCMCSVCRCVENVWILHATMVWTMKNFCNFAF